MAEIKKRILTFSTGEIIRLYGNSIAIARSMELSEGYAPNIFGLTAPVGEEKTAVVLNPHKLTADEFQELADYNIRLWMDFKDAIRRNGINSSKVFNKDLKLT